MAPISVPTQLVALPAVQRLSPRCIRILAGNPGKFTLQGTNTYLLGTGRRRILIDTGEGMPTWAASLRAILEEEKATVESALITHWHYDHIGGIRDVQAISPGVKIYKNSPEGDQLDIADGQCFRVEGVTLTAAFTPGHTADHTAFYMTEEDAMFTADNVLGQGTAVFEDMASYLSSLAKMRELFKGRAYPGHGPLLEDGPAKITEYLEHRRQREEQVLRVLGSDKGGGAVAWTPMEVVKVVYADAPAELHEAACRGVVQILEKLLGEAVVEREAEDRWRLKKHTPSL